MQQMNEEVHSFAFSVPVFLLSLSVPFYACLEFKPLILGTKSVHLDIIIVVLHARPEQKLCHT